MSNEQPSDGEISERREAAYDRVREQLTKASERADEAIERWKKKLERATERDHGPLPTGGR